MCPVREDNCKSEVNLKKKKAFKRLSRDVISDRSVNFQDENKHGGAANRMSKGQKKCDREKEVWSSKKNTTKLKEGRREKRGRDNEGGIESAELPSAVNLCQSDQHVGRTNSLQVHSVDTQAALTVTPR